ncbi:MAG: hypothetical protein ABR899_03715, partial [Candidatus Krumholzibacteriaceae bacterium]
LRDFIHLSSTSKSVMKFENGNVVSDLASSYLGTPYKQLLISSEGILNSREPIELLNNCKDDGYVFPIYNDSMIIAFMTVRYMYVTEKGIMGWLWGKIRFQSENERKYYKLLQTFPESQGYKVYVVNYRDADGRFYMIQTPDSEYSVVEGSDYIAGLLNAPRTSGAPLETMEATGAVEILRGAAAANIVKERKIEEDNKAWLKTLGDQKK